MMLCSMYSSKLVIMSTCECVAIITLHNFYNISHGIAIGYVIIFFHSQEIKYRSIGSSLTITVDYLLCYPVQAYISILSQPLLSQ